MRACTRICMPALHVHVCMFIVHTRACHTHMRSARAKHTRRTRTPYCNKKMEIFIFYWTPFLLTLTKFQNA